MKPVKPETHWSKRAIEWIDGDTAFVSVPFTWNLPTVWSRCVALKQEGYKVRAGGPAVNLIPEYLAGVAQIGGEVDALPRHNPEATFTSLGCIRHCSFCAVAKTEGDLKEKQIWIPRRIVCDNNILACSMSHYDKVMDSLKPISYVDFNQGLDARLLKPHHIDRLKELDKPMLRFAWDDVNDEGVVTDAINRVVDAGFPRSKITIYVLIGNSDTPEDALYRLVMLRDVLKVVTFPMRFQPLYALRFNKYVAPGWTDRELKRMTRYWSKQMFFRGIPYADFIG